jgi:hypothetical protein
VPSGNPEEVVMLRKAIIALAAGIPLSSCEIPTSGFAHGATAYPLAVSPGGDNGPGYMNYGRYVSGLRVNARSYRPRDVWGHWGTYYGPMIHGP